MNPETVVERAEAWVREHLPVDWVRAVDDDDPAALAVVRDELDVADWRIQLADAGLATPTWPEAYGGLGVAPPTGRLVGQVLRRYKVPRFENPIGINLAGPAILRWGTDEQKARYLRPIARHEEIWCQMFSEPGAGSDLAGLATRVVRDGDEWVVEGSKIWTSFAHIATWGLLLARSHPDLPKHQGITAFAMPVNVPGVTVRPLRHLTGDAEFNQVFFDGARIGDEQRIGPAGQGWKVAVSVLMNERVSGSGEGAALPGTVTGRSVEALIRRHAPVSDPVLAERLVRVWIEEQIIRFTNMRSAGRRAAGQPAGPEGSITKLFQSEHTQRLQDLAVDLEGPAGAAWPEDDRWRKNTAWSFLRVRSKTIAGGTSEIQRNILGERMLGLPKEPELDRTVPWKDVLRS